MVRTELTYGLLAFVKLAVTFLADVMATTQSDVPVQPPLQPANVLPTAAVARKVTVWLLVKLAEQTLPQLIEEEAPLPDRLRPVLVSIHET
jgi:hypothetical protein